LQAEGIGPDDLLLIAGGIIPDEDVPALKELGVAAVFGPGADTRDLIAFIREHAG
jgi:methylmalonyl-CoA mutase C-terminal domain/subunit